MRELGRSRKILFMQSFTLFILVVLNSFIKNPFVRKSTDRRSDFVKRYISRAYNTAVINLV